MLDIHAHILPAVDDGARDLETALQLLEMMWEQGITHVVATPHFDALSQSIEEFEYSVAKAYSELRKATDGKELPEVSLGSEVFYFSGIGKSSGISDLTLCRSDYLLLELPSCKITPDMVKDISNLRERLGIIPIIAHIERYACERGFKSLLALVERGEVYAQINAASVIDSPFKKMALKLIKKGYISFIATDTHSVLTRPPRMSQALEEIEKRFGKRTRDRFISNSQRLCKEIFRVPRGRNDEQ